MSTEPANSKAKSREVSSPSADPVEAVREIVRRGPGRCLPAERALASQIGVTRTRLREILAGLQNEGLIESRRGSGTYALPARPGALRRVVLLIDADLKLGDDPFISTLIEALQSSVQAAGLRCIIERTRGERPQRRPEDGALTLGQTGGAILTAQEPLDPPLVALLLSESARPKCSASVFQLADREAGQTAAEILIAQRCRGLVFAGRRDIPASAERWAGAQAAAQTTGIPIHFAVCPLNYAAGFSLGRETVWCEEGIGWIAANDWLALGLRVGLGQRRAPSALPIVSFDGLPLTADPSLQIASLALPYETIARDAVAELLRLHRGPGNAGRTVRYPLILSGKDGP